MMSPEAERFAGARIEAERKRASAADTEARRIERMNENTKLLEKWCAG